MRKHAKTRGIWGHAPQENFDGLLKYIEHKGLKLALLKCSKRFTEALKIHYQDHDYAQFYCLAFAQGPHTMATFPEVDHFATTYYDSALQLSSTLMHRTVNDHLIIHFC